MPFGYHGCYLRIDVSRGRGERVPLSETVLRQYIGGSGLGAWLLLENGVGSHFPADGPPGNDSRPHFPDPLSPEAPLVFAFSPLVGSPLTTSAKFAVVSRSPLTERFNDSLASSGFALAGKRCGCDAMVIVGRAREWSVLVVDDGEVRLESAGEILGEPCHVAEEKLRARLGPDHRIASQLAYDACFLAGLAKYDAPGEPHRPHKLLYALTYREDAVKPSFVVDITDFIETKMEAVRCYSSQFDGKTWVLFGKVYGR